MANTSPWWANAVLTAGLALAAAAVAISFDRRKAVNQELIKKRIAVYDEMAPKLNDILCFFCCIGDFRNLPPPTITAHKRELDRLLHVYLAIFSPGLKESYDRFIDATFDLFGGGKGTPAPIRADRDRLAGEWGDEWRVGWDKLLVKAGNASPTGKVLTAYEALMRQFAVELKVGGRGAHLPLPTLPWRNRAS